MIFRSRKVKSWPIILQSTGISLTTFYGRLSSKPITKIFKSKKAKIAKKILNKKFLLLDLLVVYLLLSTICLSLIQLLYIIIFASKKMKMTNSILNKKSLLLIYLLLKYLTIVFTPML